MRGDCALLFVLSVFLSSCATPYASEGLTGGFTQKEIEPNIWRIAYGGNGFTSAETVQTFWLYRCAELTLEKGFSGFKIVSNVPLAARDGKSPPLASGGGMIFVPMYSGESSKPFVVGDIQLLSAPIAPVLGKVFDAAALKAELEPYVTGKKCSGGNVCPHVHRYLYPVG